MLNPFAYCTGCGGEVHSREAGVNYPCGEAAPIGSVCPSWEPDHGCRCSEPDPDETEAAVALQEALEEHARNIAAGYATPYRRLCWPEDQTEEQRARRETAVERMARGLDLPVEIVTSTGTIRGTGIRITRLDEGGRPASMPPGDDPRAGRPLQDDAVLAQAARLRALLSWAAFAVAVLMIAALFAAGGPW